MKKNKKKKLNKAGYTLLELLVVVAILGIFTGMTAIAFNTVRNRNVGKYSKMVNSLISDFYKNATTKDGEWKLEISVKEENGKKIYTFAQYHEEEEIRYIGLTPIIRKTWKPYYTQTIDGTLVYAMKEINIDDCQCSFYLDGSEVSVTAGHPVSIRISRERAIFDKTNSAIDEIVFSRGAKKSTVKIVLGTPNNYIART